MPKNKKVATIEGTFTPEIESYENYKNQTWTPSQKNPGMFTMSPKTPPRKGRPPSRLKAFSGQQVSPQDLDHVYELISRITEYGLDQQAVGEGMIPWGRIRPEVRDELTKAGLVKHGVAIDPTNLSPKAQELLALWLLK